MQDGKALHHHQTELHGNTSQTKRTSFYFKKKTIKASIKFLGLTDFKIIHNIRYFRICAHY